MILRISRYVFLLILTNHSGFYKNALKYIHLQFYWGVMTWPWILESRPPGRSPSLPVCYSDNPRVCLGVRDLFLWPADVVCVSPMPRIPVDPVGKKRMVPPNGIEPSTLSLAKANGTRLPEIPRACVAKRMPQQR